MAIGTIGIVYGGPSPEHDISILTALQAERLLTMRGCQVRNLYWDRTGRWWLLARETEAKDYLNGPPGGSTEMQLTLGPTGGWSRRGRLRSEAVAVDVVLNCCHGGLGEGGGLQAVAQMLGMRCSGSHAWAAALGMDKLAFHGVVSSAGLPSLPKVALGDPSVPPFAGPYIVKPRFGGSSIGIEVVPDWPTAVALGMNSIHLRAGGIVEPYRQDLYDLNVAFKTFPALEISEVERPLRGQTAIYSYGEKYLQGEGLANAPREMPAQISDDLRGRLQDVAARVQNLTGLTGIVRVDFLSDGEEMYVNEVNSIPGAFALYLWPGRDPGSLIEDMLEECIQQRATAPPSSFEAGAALRSASGIAAKLRGFGSQA